jgi:hypothetical protein
VANPRTSVILLALAVAVLVTLAPGGTSFTDGRQSPLAQHSSAPRSLSFSFVASNYALRTLPPEAWPYATTAVLPLVDTGLHDEAGVRLVMVEGVAYDHPVAQAQFAIGLISSYLNSGDPTYLSRAEAQAQRLIDTAVLSRGALYFPYPFGFDLHGNPADAMVAPWYSAMAQGQALTALVRLFEVTGKSQYQDAAHLVFNSFTNLRADDGPWTVFVDANGYLWFEEYAQGLPDRTYNGQTFAIYGLWDYYRMTQNPDALLLLQGGMTTVAQYFPSIRVAGWVSRYCLAHGVQSGTYHQIHIDQALQLYRMTGAVQFGREADLLFVDYPNPILSGTVHFSAGTHTGYKFNPSGGIVSSRPYTLSRISTAPFSLRVRIKGRSGYWLRITAGIWAGYMIPEAPGRSYVAGLLPLRLTYDPLRTVTFAAGRYTGYTFNPAGAVTTSRTATLPRPSQAATDQRVTINGVAHVRIVNGIWAGMYVPLSTGVSY